MSHFLLEHSASLMYKIHSWGASGCSGDVLWQWHEPLVRGGPRTFPPPPFIRLVASGQNGEQQKKEFAYNVATSDIWRQLLPHQAWIGNYQAPCHSKAGVTRSVAFPRFL